MLVSFFSFLWISFNGSFAIIFLLYSVFFFFRDWFSEQSLLLRWNFPRNWNFEDPGASWLEWQPVGVRFLFPSFPPFSFSFFLMDLCSTSMNRDIPIEFKNLTNLKHLELNENDFKVPPSLLAHLLLLLLLLLFSSHPFKHWNPLVRSFPIPFICCRTWKFSPWRRTKSSTWARRWKTGKRWGQGLLWFFFFSLSWSEAQAKFVLQELNLNQNAIVVIPSEIGQLKSLVKLYLALNKIQKFPAEGSF